MTLAVFVAIVLPGCGSSSTDQSAQQRAIAQARREGAQTARQNAKIHELQREVRQQRDPSGGGVVPSAGTTTTATSTPSVSSLVASYVPYQPSEPTYGYVAEVPSGGGWTSPEESHPTSGSLLRTSLRGPDGTLLIIDRTPDEVPTLGGSYDSSNTVSQPTFGSATEYIFSRSQGLPDCNGRPCVDFLINDGSGGGWGVLGGGPSLAVAESIASHVAQSISFGD